MRSRYAIPVIAAALLASAPVTAQRGPAPGMLHLPANVIAQSCSPKMSFERPPTPLRITGGQDSFVRYSYAPGDLLTVNAGSDNGIEVGQEYFVRRVPQRFQRFESWEALTAPTSLALACRWRSRPQHHQATRCGAAKYSYLMTRLHS